MKPYTTKKTILNTIAVFFIKKISNCFWEIADSWSYKNKKIAQYYDNSIQEEYQKECKTYNISSNTKVLHIGCGAYPLTELVLAQCCSGILVGIDKNPKAVQRAQKVIQRHHLQGRISIALGNGVDYPVDDFDMILISSCSLPKVKILEHLIKNTKPHSMIIVREMSIAAADILGCVQAHPKIEIIQHMNHSPFPFYGPLGWDTFYLRKL